MCRLSRQLIQILQITTDKKEMKGYDINIMHTV